MDELKSSRSLCCLDSKEVHHASCGRGGSEALALRYMRVTMANTHPDPVAAIVTLTLTNLGQKCKTSSLLSDHQRHSFAHSGTSRRCSHGDGRLTGQSRAAVRTLVVWSDSEVARPQGRGE
ncbi:hypothetical protein DPEC_G00065780 [Dallia pectoralis]|uniref:Uncharacterized protein n=1 Tax=Dallia pectoralis TaxID=75939 RepID=A0ACC2H9C3_DALPE|nr:hypothetical protein DPEC_G00065780 [Dallia pectoralis]